MPWRWSRSDERVVAGVLGGRREDFSVLVHRYLPVVHAVAYARIGNPHDADDIVQDAFLHAFRELGALRHREKFGPWLVSIACNICKNFIAKRGREKAVVEELRRATTPESPDPARAELHQILREHIEALDEGSREVLLLHYFAGKGVREMAGLLRISREAAKKRLQHAREKLGSRMLSALGTLSEGDRAQREKRVGAVMATVVREAVPWLQESKGAALAAGVSLSTKLLIGAVVCVCTLLAGYQLTKSIALRQPQLPPLQVDLAGQPVPPAQVAAPGERIENETDEPALPPAQDSPTEVLHTGTIAGRVVDADTAGSIPGVRLGFYRTPSQSDGRVRGDIGPSCHGTSDDKGAFLVSRLRAGAYMILVEDDVWLTANEQRPRVEVQEGRVTEGVVVSARKGGVISGRVYDADTGTGVEGVDVEAGYARKTVTDKDGSYRLTGLGRGVCNVARARLPGYSRVLREDSRRVTIEVGEEIGDVDFPLYRGLTVSGSVVDAGGRPVGGAEVLARVWKHRAQDTRIFEHLTAESDPNGAFVLEGFIPDTEISLEASKPGFATRGWEKFVLENADVTDRELVLYRAGASIAGRVRDTRDRPLAKATVYCQKKPLPTTTDDAGRFAFDGLLAGSYKLSVIPAGRELHTDNEVYLATIELDDDERVEGLELVCDPHGGLAISGRLTDTHGKAVAGADVYAGGPTAARTTSGRDGFFIFENLEEGRYVLEIAKGSFHHAGILVKAGTEDVQIALDIPEDTSFDYVIVGEVLSAETDEPITSFEYSIHSLAKLPAGHRVFPPDDQGLNVKMMPRFTAVRDSGGRFRIDMRHVAEYVMMVRAKGFAGQFKRFSVTSGPQKEFPLTFRLGPAAIVEGRVLDPAGKPLEGALILPGVFGTRGVARPEEALARTDAQGRFRVDWLEPVPQILTAYHTDYNLGEASVEPMPGRIAQVTITMGAAGSVEGNIWLDGQAFQEQVSINVNYLDKEISLKYARVLTAEDGTFRIDRLPPGEIIVSAHPDPYREQHGPIHTVRKPSSIESGKTTRVDLDFTTGAGLLDGTILLDDQKPTTASCVLTYAHDDCEETFALYHLHTGQYRFSELPAGNAVLTVRATMADEAALARPWLAEPFVEYKERIEVYIGPETEGVLDIPLSSETSEARFSHG